MRRSGQHRCVSTKVTSSLSSTSPRSCTRRHPITVRTAWCSSPVGSLSCAVLPGAWSPCCGVGTQGEERHRPPPDPAHLSAAGGGFARIAYLFDPATPRLKPAAAYLAAIVHPAKPSASTPHCSRSGSESHSREAPDPPRTDIRALRSNSPQRQCPTRRPGLRK